MLFLIADDEGFWKLGRRGVFIMLSQLSPIAGDSPQREATPSEHGERRAGLAGREEKSVL